MKFFIDSGNLKDYEALVPLGIIDGATTNPSLMAKEGGDPRAIIKKICGWCRGRSAPKSSRPTPAGMIAEGRELAKIDEHVVVKVPVHPRRRQGLQDAGGRGAAVNVTLIFSPTQALFAAKVGAAYVSPFVGRLDDIASDGMRLIQEIATIFENYAFTTEILVASVRSPMHIVQAAMMGADVCTCPACRDRRVLQSSADRHRPAEIPQGLGKGAGGEGVRAGDGLRLRL